jgi:N-acetylglutamate synthase-like GNAT family acetyltransferase
MITLRPATAEDDPAIRWLVHTGQINPTGLRWPRFVVAVDAAGQVVGCGQIKPHGDGSYELASLAVHPDWRGQGIARAIIEHLVAAHPGPLHLICRAELGPLYEKFGFRVVENREMPRYFQRLVCLARLLSSLSSQGQGLLVMRRG